MASPASTGTAAAGDLLDALNRWFLASDGGGQLGNYAVAQDTNSAAWTTLMTALEQESFPAIWPDAKNLLNVAECLTRSSSEKFLLLESTKPKPRISHVLVRLASDSDLNLDVQVLLLRWMERSGGFASQNSGRFSDAMGLRFEVGYFDVEPHHFPHCQLTPAIGKNRVDVVHKLLTRAPDSQNCACFGCQIAKFDSVPAIPLHGADNWTASLPATLIKAARLAIDGCTCADHRGSSVGGEHCVRCGSILP